jgi:hypothetical protein
MLRLVNIILFFSVIIISLTACTMFDNERKMKESFQPAIDALEKYFKDKNNYPESLDALVPEYLPAVPQCPEEYRKWSSGYYKNKDGEYSIVCMVGIIIFYPQRLEYTSDGNRWLTWD